MVHRADRGHVHRVRVGEAGQVGDDDDHDAIPQIIAANYAYSLGADLVLITQRDDSLRDDIYREIDERAAHRDELRGTNACKALAAIGAILAPDLAFGARSFITFITRGIPYGYFCNTTPSTHLFSSPHLGELIIAGIYWATRSQQCLAAVLVDPGDFPESETPRVATSLARGGVVVEEVVGTSATTEMVRLYMQAYPYDLLFICSHCGEVPGRRLLVSVPDRQGNECILEMEEALQFAAVSFADVPGRDVEVFQLIRPISTNGIPCRTAASDADRYAGVWAHLHRTPRENWKVLFEEKVSHVTHSTAIKVRHGCVMLNLIHVIEVSVSPIIFNNGCVSYYDAAQTLTFAGARSYVGTLAPVSSVAAQRLAETLFQERLRELSLPLALWEVQQRVFPDPNDRTYVHVGCHFVRIVPPRRDVTELVSARLEDALERWQQPSKVGNQCASDMTGMFTRFLHRLLNR